MAERRRFKRFELSLKIGLDKNNEGPLQYLGKMVNISRYGLMASVKNPRELLVNGQTLGIKVTLPGKKETVVCEGAVKHIAQMDNELVIGFEIKKMDHSSKSDILEMAYKAWKKKGVGRE